MDHEEAARMQATFRYLIGDLSEDETAAFEAHFFDCAECADDVKVGAAFAEAAREVFQEESRKNREGWLSRWRGRVWLGFAFPAAAAASCVGLALLTMQNVGLKQQLAVLSQPQQPSAITLKVARGAEAFHVPRTAPFWEARFRLPNPTAGATYKCGIQRAGKQVKTVSLDAPANGQPFSILMRSSEFPAGSYLFEVRASNGDTVLSTYSLDLIYD